MLSRVLRVGAMLVVVGLMAVPAVAQQGRRGGPGGFGMRGGGGAFELLNLLSAPEVRQEVKLSDEGYAAVEKLQRENQEALRSVFGRGRPSSDEDREKARTEMMAKMKEINEKSQAVLEEVLPPEGYDRLLGLHVQLRGDSAAASDLVAKKIGLSDADREKVQEAVTKTYQEAGRPGRQGGEGDREQIRARIEEMRKKADEAARSAMSDEQKKALDDLKGAKFEFPESVRNPGFGFGGPGGRRGGRPDRDSNN